MEDRERRTEDWGQRTLAEGRMMGDREWRIRDR